MGNIISDYVVAASPVAVPSTKDFVQDLITKCQNRNLKENLNIEADPYEVYKDDEGFDYVFVA